MGSPSAVLMDLLQAAQSPEPVTRQRAEETLRSAEKQAGYALALVQTALRTDVQPNLRQLAALLLKRYVRTHWSADNDNFEEPVISDAEKDSIRKELPNGLADANSKIRTAVAMVVAGIAKWDVPDAWPTLHQDLVAAISSRSSALLVSGAVRCLSMFMDELDEEQVVQIMPVLLPDLLALIKQPGAYEVSVQRRAVGIMRAVVACSVNAVGPYKIQARSSLLPHLEPWLQQFCDILSRPLRPGAPSPEGALKMEVLKALVLLFGHLGKHVQAAAPAVLQRCWGLFTDCLPAYQQVVDGSASGEDEEVDSEGDTLNLNALVSQLFEFLLAVAGSSRFQGQLLPGLQQLIHHTLGYMQITAAEEGSWSQDVNQLLADEQECVFALRSSGGLLLEELVAAAPGPTAAALSAAVQQRMAEAASLKAEGRQRWWKLREAALLAVGGVADSLSQTEPQPHFQVGPLLADVLRQDLASDAPPLLQHRALWLACRYVDALDGPSKAFLLQTASAGLGADRSPLIQVAACQAVAELSDGVAPAEMRPILPAIFTGLGGLLSKFEEEAAQRVLEALGAVIKADPETAAVWQPQVTPPLLHIWATHFTDPLLGMETVEVFEALAAIPQALPGLQEQALPALRSILAEPDRGQPVMVEGALDLAAALLHAAPPQEAVRTHAALSQPVMHLLMTHDDPAVLQSCCEYLRVLIKRGGTAVLCYGGADPEATMREIVAALKRLLRPDAGDSAPLLVGQVLTSMLTAAQERAVAAVADALPAAVEKLATARSSPLIVALLGVFAQFVHTDAGQLIEYLAAAPAPGGQGSALDLLLRVWTERALEFKGAAEIKLSTTALAGLLAARHPALSSVQVKGRLLDVDSGIRTRSRAAHQAEQWQWVPAPAKLLALLADALIELKEGGVEQDEASEWESASDSDDGSVSPYGVPTAILKAVQEDDQPPERGLPEEEGPLAGVDLAGFVQASLRRVAQEDGQLFESCCRMLSPLQLQAVQACF